MRANMSLLQLPIQVPGNLANFLKQASLDTAKAVLQQQEATPPTPGARHLAGGAGAVWPFNVQSMPWLRSVNLPAEGSPSSRLGSLSLQSQQHTATRSDQTSSKLGLICKRSP